MNNLANVNVPGYKRKDMDFNVTLESKMTGSSRAREAMAEMGDTDNASSIRRDGNNVDLEQEVMNISQTELRYQAISDLTAGYFSGLKSVIREGR